MFDVKQVRLLSFVDMLLLTYDHKLSLRSFPDVKNPLKPQTHQHSITQKATVDIWELSGGSPPVAMATGFLRPYQSMIQVRQQVVVVLASDWTVVCLDHELRLLWKSQPIKHTEDTIHIREAAILVSPISIQKGDTGSVIVGGRMFSTQKPQESFKRMRRGEKPEDEEKLIESLGHYTTFALEGRSGELRWQHMPADFQVHPAFPPDVSSFHHLKLVLHKQLSHEGEVSWHQYSNAIRSALPHSWLRTTDTHFALAHFKKDRRKRREPDVSEHISRVSDLAVGHIAGLTFGGLRPHSSSEHVQDPNVLIIHSAKGIDVLHLYQGRPLCSLPLSPYHATHADINADGNIDHVHAVVNPGEAGFSPSEDDSDCYGRAVSMTVGKRLFKHSICKATHWTETFIATDSKWTCCFVCCCCCNKVCSCCLFAVVVAALRSLVVVVVVLRSLDVVLFVCCCCCCCTKVSSCHFVCCCCCCCTKVCNWNCYSVVVAPKSPVVD